MSEFELNPLDVESWDCCEEHETTYLKNSYCKDCRITELEREWGKLWSDLITSNTENKCLGDSLAAVEKKLKSNDHWNLAVREKKRADKLQEQVEAVRTLPDELLSMTLTYDSETDPVTEIEIAVDKIKAAIGEES